ncbi:MAG: ABC transporter ATP-binding protein [Deinococcota bacterium]
MLSANNLSLGYDKTNIIEGLELAIRKHQITALIGPNGCGKSTLLRGLARLLKPRGGSVYLDGNELQKMPTKAIAKRLGILPQGPSAPEGLTVRELVAQGRYPHQTFFQQWTEADERASQEALELTHMLELADRPLESLSGGQRQRAWIAMTLAQETEIFLLDEPTTFLDLAHQIEVMDLLANLNQQRNATIVVVLHDLNQAARYADQLVVLKDGQIVATGSGDEVMTTTCLRQVFGLECHVICDPVSGTPLCIPLSRSNLPRAVSAEAS